MVGRILSWLLAVAITLGTSPVSAQMYPGVRSIPLLSGRAFPGAFNVTPAWLNRLKQGWRTKDVVFVGESVIRGYGAGEGGTGWTNAVNHAVPAVLAQLLRARGYTARSDAWFGDGEGQAGLIADFLVANSNNVVGASWAILASPAEAAGGALAHDNSGTSLMNFTPDQACDRFIVHYRRATGSASFQIDSETALTYDMATVTNFTLTSGIQQLVLTSGSGVGTHTLKIGRISGDVQIYGVDPVRSAGGEKRVLNLGRDGDTTGLAVNSATNTSPLPSLKTLLQLRTAPLVIIEFGINDQNQNVLLTDFKAQMQTVINGVVAAGGLPMLLGHHATSTTPSAAYLSAQRDLALANGIPLLDLSYYFPTWAGLQGLGYTFDGSSHLIAAGYAAEAVPLDGFLAWATN